MGKRFTSLNDDHRAFIAKQSIFFAATAAPTGRINVSPRGADAFRIVGDGEVAFLDRTGSGSETSAHLMADGRMTIMFCAFEGAPNILRLYGRGMSLRRPSREYAEAVATLFGGDEPAGARQVVKLAVELVQTSCGYGVPLFDFAGERPSLDNWATAKGEAGLAEYRREKNAASLDGLPTGFGA
ncbi:MAG: pyridoxamine 5'-phosphate oxidase family protein [Hyphomicrobiales bacterium]|nr:pyridoxamine 5'-phosphate oxidase family protein [Hyphomicrobiales bacterium]